MADTLEAAGYARVVIDSDLSRTPALHRVRIGPFARSDNIADVVDDLSAAGVSGTYLIVEQ
jgi:cell division protein FtsN